MTILDKHADQLILPKINRCNPDRCNLYQLILQKRSTNHLFVFKLRDYSSGHPLRYRFKFAVPEEMEFGEYQLFLVRASEWQLEELNDLFIRDTYRQTDKGAVLLNGQYLVSNGRVMVTGQKRAAVKALNDFTGDTGVFYCFTEQSDDLRACGDLYEELEVLYSGLLKLVPDALSEPEPPVEMTNTNQNKFVEYGG